MNPRNIILIAVAGLGVLLVMLMTRSFLTGVQEEAAQTQAVSVKNLTAEVMVAAHNLPVGTIIKGKDLAWQPWPEEGLNDAYFNKGGDKAKDLQDMEGKVIRAPITKGEPITRTSVVAQGERGFMAAILTPGMRAVSVKVSAVTGIGGFIFPGDRVDVILTHIVEAGQKKRYTIAETVFQNVRVLGIDQRSETSEPKAMVGKTVTLEVTPKMAEKVAMLERLGTLSLSLRSLASDDEELNAGPSSPPISQTLTQTLGNEISKYLPAPNKSTPSNLVRVSRGTSVSVVRVLSDDQPQEGDE